ncbi:MAG: hypothetical protein JOZ74_13225 [Bradyrhizobium sp.]|nr:hypothetical protein [Bradyrhizobium sp.]
MGLNRPFYLLVPLFGGPAEIAQIGDEEAPSAFRKFVGDLPVHRGFGIRGRPRPVTRTARRPSLIRAKPIEGLHEPGGPAKSFGAFLAVRFEGQISALEQVQDEDGARPLRHGQSLGKAAWPSMK